MNLDINVVCSSHFVVNVDQGHFSTSQPYPRGRVPLWRWWKWRRGRIGADIWPLPKTIIHSWPSSQERPQISLRGLLITAASFYFHLIYWYLYMMPYLRLSWSCYLSCDVCTSHYLWAVVDCFAVFYIPYNLSSNILVIVFI